ncbi:MAG: MnhB domain-containing protein [candidate division WOR-3 bacterium]|nr:MnhB domain-containing protein [candidate division WOR-3 bacterium]
MKENRKSGMTFIVKMITNIMIGFMIVFGSYIVLFGHITPGGGFPGGVMIALAYILVTLAYGRNIVERKVSGITASVVDDLGALAFWFIGIVGLCVGGEFLYNFLGKGKPFHIFSAGTIILNNIAITLKVGMSLYAIFLALAILGRVVTDKNERKDEQ